MKTVLPLLVPALWGVSLLASLPFFQPYELYRLLALAALLGAWVVMLSLPAARAATLRITPLTALIMAFALWCGATFIWSISPFVTVIAGGALWLLPLWYLMFAVMPVTTGQINGTLATAVLVGAIMGVWALAQYTIWPHFLNQNGNIRFPFADPNNYAGLLNLGLFMALGLLVRGPRRPWEGWLLRAAILLMLVALVLIGSRMAMVCTLVGLVVFAFCLRRQAVPVSLPQRWLVPGLVAVMIAVLLVSGLWSGTRLTTFERVLELTALHGDKSIVARFDIWMATGRLISHHLWQGAGLGTFFLLYPAVRLPGEIYSSGLMAHADPLQFWAEAGVPAVLLFYAILLLVLRRFLRYMARPAADDRPDSGLVIGLFCALLTLALHLHVTFHLYVPALLVMAGLALGAFTRLTAPPEEQGLRLPFQTSATLGFLVLLGLGVLYQSCLFSEMHARQAAIALAQGDLHTFSRRVNQAGREGFGLNPRPYVQAASIPLGLLQTSRGPERERESLFAQADQLLDRALAASPVNAGAYYAKALLYGVMGLPEVDHYIDLTLRYDPQHAQARQLRKAREALAKPLP